MKKLTKLIGLKKKYEGELLLITALFLVFLGYLILML